MPNEIKRGMLVQWDFGKNLSVITDNPWSMGTQLNGRFSNLHQDVLAGGSNGKTRVPALCNGTSNLLKNTKNCYYDDYFREEISLYWNPSMHADDSELVPLLGLSYMAPFPHLYQLLSPANKKVKIPIRYTFTMHGNPMGTPAQINGSFFNKS